MELNVFCVYFWDEYFVCCEYGRIVIINNDGEILKMFYGLDIVLVYFGYLMIVKNYICLMLKF